MTTARALPPGPTSPALLQGLQTITRPVAFFAACLRRWGDAFTLRLPVGGTYVLFSHPDAVREIFTTDGEVARAGEAASILRPIVGAHSLLLLDGDRHLRERRLLLPPFVGDRMLAYATAMREVAARAIDGWPVGRPFPAARAFQSITLDVILRTVFGLRDVDGRVDLAALLREFAGVAQHTALLWPPAQIDLGRWSPWGRFVRLRRAIGDAFAAELVRRRAGDVAAGDDVLSLLLAARDEDGEPLSDAALRDELMTLLLAGHETTATALAWVLERLLADASLQARLRAELAEVGGGGPVAPSDLGRLVWLDATIKETLRLRPVVPDVGRVLHAPARIGGWDLPAGVTATPFIYGAHRRAEVWPDPERFDPARFIGLRPSPYEFFPFGGGTRRCIGMGFALLEMKVVLAEILGRVELVAAPRYRARVVRRSVTLAPSAGMPVVVQRRAA